MKKFYLIIFMLLIFMLSACQEKMEPYLDVNIGDFTVEHAEDNFTIWKRKNDYDEWGMTRSYPSYTYDFPNETCSADFVNWNWLLEYENDFYYIGQGFQIDLYDPYDLEEYGITFTCTDK